MDTIKIPESVRETFTNPNGATVTIDRHALRFGDSCAGWVVVFGWPDEHGDTAGFDVAAALFPDVDSAIRRVEHVSRGFTIVIRALRVATKRDLGIS